MRLQPFFFQASGRRRCGLNFRGRAAKPGAATLACFVFVTVLNPGQPAHAYLDPGTGSLLLQMMLGGVAGLLLVGKLYWQRFKELFRRDPKDPGTLSDSPPDR